MNDAYTMMQPPRRKQRGFIIDPFRFGGGGGGPTDPYFSSVVQLAHFDGADNSTTFTNSCPRGTTLVAAGTATLKVAQFKWGTASLRCTGTTAGAQDTASVTDYGFGTGDFTIEYWQRLDNVTTSWNIFFWKNGSSDTGWYITNSGIAHVYISSVDRIVSASNALVATTWQHIAYSRSGGNLGEFYVAGTRIGSWADVTNYGANGPMYVGKAGGGTGMVGYIDDLRVTKGVARYTGATCAVPTEAFPDS